MEGRNQFTFYRSFYEAVLKLPKSRQLGMFFAIARYGLDMEEPEGLNAQQEGQFRLIRPVLRTAWRKAMAGALGGRKSKRGAAEKISKGEQEKEIEIETEIEIESESEGEREAFDRFWARYPVQIGQTAALHAWQSVTEKHDIALILSRLEIWRRSKEWAREDGRFIPKPEKWLAEEWFLRSPPTTVPLGATGELGQAELEAIQKLLRDG